jgi:hypothetical protein
MIKSEAPPIKKGFAPMDELRSFTLALGVSKPWSPSVLIALLWVLRRH